MIFSMPSKSAFLLAALSATLSLILLNLRIFQAIYRVSTSSAHGKRSFKNIDSSKIQYNNKKYNMNVNPLEENLPQNSAKTTAKEILPTYTLPSSLLSLPLREPSHLTPIPPSLLIPLDNHPIDITHRRGLMHVGHCLFVMDKRGKMLFLKRSKEVVTCPNTWSILGEHSVAGEVNDGWDVVFRGMFEELGLIVSVDADGPNNSGVGWNAVDADETEKITIEAEGRQRSNRYDGGADEPEHPIVPVTIRNVTQYPLYYIRHYGQRKDNRVDRQITYLWLGQLHKRYEEIEWRLDEEVADHKWISVGAFEDWLSNDEEEMRSSEAEFGDGTVDGVKDDGPAQGDFCHWTIRTLYQAGLKGLKQIIVNENS
mmetsp:Transcript_2152/g.4534  ORF Transcript_2152/g.4534 Transcript_2152/m.4534 type:complete len:369 (+) Transcript_2152:352-1458(+)